MNKKINQVVKEIKKRENVVIRLSRGYLGAHKYVEIRQYVMDKSGEYRPTQKGFTFNPELLDGFIEGFTELKKSFDGVS